MLVPDPRLDPPSGRGQAPIGDPDDLEGCSAFVFVLVFSVIPDLIGDPVSFLLPS